MADYTLPEVVEKRVRFFDGQFLQDQDFIDEQDYQLDREHRHNRLLHGPGIVDGLAVTSPGPRQVIVSPGTAIDSDGNQLVLAQATTVDLSAPAFADQQGIQLYISYLASPEDPQAVVGSADFTRWLERPELTALAPGQSYSGTAPPVLLANLALDNAGRVTVDASVRSYSGARLPGSGADAVTLSATSSGPVHLNGSLTVDGSVGIGTLSPANDLEVGSYQTQDRYLALKVAGGNQHISGVKMWTWQENYGYSLMYDERHETGNGLHVKTHNVDPNGTSRLFVGWDGNTGINTTQPTASLHLNVPSSGTQITALQVDVQSFQTMQNAAASYFLRMRDVGASGFTQFCVCGNGYVGIGTATPTARLEVVGGGDTSVDLVVNGQLRSGSDNGGLWVSGDRFVGGFETSKIGFLNGGDWRLAVLSNGHIGIGTTNPENAENWNMNLDILATGNAKLSMRTAAAETRVMVHESGYWGSQPGMVLGTKTNHALSLATNAATRLTVSNAGSVGIGITQPAASLHLNVPSSPAPIGALLIDVQSFQTGQNAAASYFLRMRDVGAGDFTHFCVLGNGSVGIGTADTTSAKLVVQGTTMISGNVGIGIAPTGKQALTVAGQTYLKGGLYAGGGFWYQLPSGDWWGIGAVPNGQPSAWWMGTGPAGPPDTSDVRLKTGLRPIGDALDLVRKLNGVRYQWGEAGVSHFTRGIDDSVSAGPGATDEQNQRIRAEHRTAAQGQLAGDRMGLVAQDVEAVIPELVYADDDGYKHIRYQHLTALLTEAIKEQDAVVQALSAQVAALQAGPA